MPTLPKIGEEVTAAAAPLEVRPELPPIGGEVGQARTPDFTATNEPPSTALKAAAYGKDALQLALDALPGAGAVVGGALATPETLGGGTLAGAALGAGAGRGLRDVISAGLGLEKPTTAIAEGGKIALDTGETAIAGLVLPALWSAIKRPGATVADVYGEMRKLYAVTPKALKAFLPDVEALAKLPKGVGKAPAAILERPAWQTWQEHLPDAQPSPQVARTTGTSMIPAAVPGPRPTTSPPAATPTPVTVEPPMATQAPARATADFKKWFGASDITDENNVPKVMYHGTNQTFSQFKPSAEGAIYLTDDPAIAADYGKHIKPLYVAAQRVLDLGTDPYDFTDLIHQVNRVDSELGDRIARVAVSHGPEGGARGVYAALRDPEVIDALKRRGFDGVRFADDHGPNQKPIVLAVFSGDQLRSAAVTATPPAATPVPAPVTVEPPIAIPAPAPMSAAPPIATPAPRLNQIAINGLGLAARRAKLDLSLDEVKLLVPMVEQGATPEQVIGAVVASRQAANPAAAFTARFGTPTSAEAAADMARRRAVRKSR